MITLDPTHKPPGIWNPIEMQEAIAMARVQYALERGSLKLPPYVVRCILDGGKVQ